MQFTADQAIEASQDGDPIWISDDFAERICQQHGTSIDHRGGAGQLLLWLGY